MTLRGQKPKSVFDVKYMEMLDPKNVTVGHIESSSSLDRLLKVFSRVVCCSVSVK